VRNVLIALLLLQVLVVAAPAAAQTPGGQDGFRPNLMGDPSHRKTYEEVQEEQDREKAYKSGISKIPDQKAKSDPWGAVRTTPATATTPPPAAKTQPTASANQKSTAK
jgi:hypothetical protein